MRENFDECLKETLKWEGGYSDHPEDPGGKTNFGVTWERYDEYREDKGLAKRSVKRITYDEVQEIYKKYYWDAVNGDERPSGVDLVIFDFGVNSGPSRARKYAGLVAKAGLNDPQFITAYCDARLRFLQGLSTWKTFGKGWGRRVEGIRDKALDMNIREGGPKEEISGSGEIVKTSLWDRLF